jgi:glycosyltransferase involved in cell wall biosynthesis
MRILYLSQLVPYPPDAGPKVRQYYALRYLMQHHQVTLVAFSRPEDTPEALDHLKGLGLTVHTVPMKRAKWRDGLALVTSLLSGQSFVIRRDWVQAMAALVQKELSQGSYDIIQADQLWMAQYGLLAENLAKEGRTTKPWLVLDEHNACYQIPQRLAQGERNLLKRMVMEREWRALRSYEAQTCARYDHVVTVTEEDRVILEGMVRQVNGSMQEGGKPRTAFSTIPICVDTAAVQPVAPSWGLHNVLHLGTMFWPPNVEGVVWFAREVWPLVRKMVPGARFTVVGKNPPEAVRALAGEGSGIAVTGYVADPLTYLQGAGAFIVPLFSAGGMRVKIVDGWRWGLPVISTSVGAEGIRYREGENILIADRADSFARAVVDVLLDVELNQRLRANGRRWVEEKYDWQRVYPAWEEVYRLNRID